MVSSPEFYFIPRSIGPLGKELTVESGSKASSFLCFLFLFLFCFFCFFVRLLDHRLDLASVVVNSTEPYLVERTILDHVIQ